MVVKCVNACFKGKVGICDNNFECACVGFVAVLCYCVSDLMSSNGLEAYFINRFTVESVYDAFTVNALGVNCDNVVCVIECEAVRSDGYSIVSILNDNVCKFSLFYRDVDSAAFFCIACLCDCVIYNVISVSRDLDFGNRCAV